MFGTQKNSDVSWQRYINHPGIRQNGGRTSNGGWSLQGA